MPHPSSPYTSYGAGRNGKRLRVPAYVENVEEEYVLWIQGVISPLTATLPYELSVRPGSTVPKWAERSETAEQAPDLMFSTHTK